MSSSRNDRYHRQSILPQIGAAGQARLAESAVLLVGCGALGCSLAELLVRAGVGELRIVDRDIVEITNLQRQVLFDEADARAGAPKAVAAADRLRSINSEVRVEALIEDVTSLNVERLAGLDDEKQQPRVSLILDGTDNVATRYLLNDVAVKHGVPWVYGACVGTEGRSMAIRPGRTPCLRCVFPDPPDARELPTCDTAGVLGPAATLVAALQATAALKLLTGAEPGESDGLVSFDLWAGRFHTLRLADARLRECRACGQRQFDFLSAQGPSGLTALCGRDAVQVRPQQANLQIDLPTIAHKLSNLGELQVTPYLLRCTLDGSLRLTLFRDGRLIVHGTSDFDRARSIYARYVGA